MCRGDVRPTSVFGSGTGLLIQMLCNFVFGVCIGLVACVQQPGLSSGFVVMLLRALLVLVVIMLLLLLLLHLQIIIVAIIIEFGESLSCLSHIVEHVLAAAESNPGCLRHHPWEEARRTPV